MPARVDDLELRPGPRLCFERAVRMLKFKLTLAYDGSAYHGWQSQKSGRGVADQIGRAHV